MTTCSRVLTTASALGLVFLFLAAPVFAHGGNFKVPADPGGPSAPGSPSAPPGWIPPTTPRFPTPPPSGKLVRSSTWTPCSWNTWWQLNLEAHLPRWGDTATYGVITESESLYRVGCAAVGSDAPIRNSRVERGATLFALPYLMSRIDRTEDVEPGMVSTALIAVARIAREEAPIDLFRLWAVDRRATLEERESAILALGLLRRTEPSRQLDDDELCRVRDFLLMMFDDEKAPMRVRAFAVLSLALLADQPWGRCAIEKDGRLLTRALWRRLEKKYPSQELTIALFTALGHQPPEGVPAGIRERLKKIALGRPVFRRKWDAMERSHALAALARLGGAGCHLTLLNMLRMNRIPDAVQSSALIGLAQRAPAMSSEERVDAARALRRALTNDRHWQVRGLGHITLGIVLATDLRLGHHGVLDRTDVLRYLDGQARKGSTITRPFSALALGLAAFDVPSSSRPTAAALQKIRKTLTWGLCFARGSDEVVGAYAVGAGLARAEGARPLLLEILANRNRGYMLRGHAALALGQLGRATADVTAALLEATRERVAPFIQTQAVRALALLDVPGVREELISQLAGKKTSRPAIAVVAGSLGRVRDPEAVSQLLDLAQDEKASRYVRIAAVMALGLTFDPEPRPSRVLLTTHANYPSLTWSLQQVFNIM